MTAAATIYTGEVVHKRLRPKPHALAYGVFSLLLDLDRLTETDAASRLFSVNRFNLLAYFDRDHGPGDGTALSSHARDLFARAGIDTTASRILLLAYPRVLGYVFNPLSVVYAVAADDTLQGLIYEVNNTWGERRSYVVAAGAVHGRVYAQAARKDLHVSPFAAATGRYGFRVIAPGDDILVGVLLSDDDGALLRTHFKAVAEPWSDRKLAGLLLRYPLLTLKIIGAIHIEAFRLWWKGVPLTAGASRPGYAVTFVTNSETGTAKT